jgi:adenylate cyclase
MRFLKSSLYREALQLFAGRHFVDRLDQLGSAALTPATQETHLLIYAQSLSGFGVAETALTSQALMQIVNDHIDRAERAIETSGGTVIDFDLDTLVAVWGLEKPSDIRAALQGLARLHQASVLPGVPGLNVVGALHEGPALFGYFGGGSRRKLGVFGAAVNVARGLSNLNPSYGTRLLATESVAQACGPNVPVREIDRIRARGFKEPVTIFEVCV